MASTQAIKRLMKDQEELIKSPVINVSATPLDNDMFEWHCNIKYNTNIYHLILYFPTNYPYEPPSAEFAPIGISMNQYIFRRGTKGDQTCLSIFSGFGHVFRRGANKASLDWSASYTVQTILLNVVSFMHQLNINTPGYQKMCQGYTCPNCGHTFHEPFPPLKAEPEGRAEGTSQDSGPGNASDSKLTEISSQIVDYVSKETFDHTDVPSQDGVFGYGLVFNLDEREYVTSPFEFLTAGSFYGMQTSFGRAHSVLRQNLSCFLPLYINKQHGSQITHAFQNFIASVTAFMPEGVIKVSVIDWIFEMILDLMCWTVDEFSEGRNGASENNVRGIFALHRLLLWMLETYTEFEDGIEKRLASLTWAPTNRRKDSCRDIGHWLMLLSLSKRFSWPAIADACLSECYDRDVMEYLQQDDKLSDPSICQQYRLRRTFQLTAASRNRLTLQVAFLRVANPEGMSREDILDRYESNLGFPTVDMMREMKTMCQKIESGIKDYADWYTALGLPIPSNDSLTSTLMESVNYVKATCGYHAKSKSHRR